MEFKYKRIKSHANDFWYAETISIGAKIIAFCFRASLIIGTILGTGYWVGKILE